MRITIALLLACSVALALAPPASAEEIPYAKVETDSVRLLELAEDAKIICWKGLSAPRSQITQTIQNEMDSRDYNKKDELIMWLMCTVYKEGASDGIQVATASRTNRT